MHWRTAMSHYIIFAVALSLLCGTALGQHLGISFQDAELQGLSVDSLDGVYQGAVNVDSSLSVFKSEEQQDAMYDAYVSLLDELNNFLSEHGFKWDKRTKCFNRIYFHADGSIDYFLYNFTDDQPSAEKKMEFKRLLNLFIQDYTLLLTAKTKFAQCSPVTYVPKDK